MNYKELKNILIKAKQEQPAEYNLFVKTLKDYIDHGVIFDPLIENEFKLITRGMNKQGLKLLYTLLTEEDNEDN